MPKPFLKKFVKKNSFSINLIAILQGRLVDVKKNLIQSFPLDQWIYELSLAKKNKFKFIEWVASYDNIKKNPIYNKKNIKKINQLKKKYKINFRSIDLQFFVEAPFFKSKKKFLYRYNLLKKIIINAQKIGIKYLVLPVLEKANINNTEQEDKFLFYVKKILKYIKNENYLLLETDYEANNLLKLIKKINSKKIGINYDLGNRGFFGSDIKKDQIYFKYIKNIHIKDKNLNGLSVRLGRGIVNFKKNFYYLKKFKYKGFFSLQSARSESNNHLEEIKNNFKFLKKNKYFE